MHFLSFLWMKFGLSHVSFILKSNNENGIKIS